jgi:hypothetical protein
MATNISKEPAASILRMEEFYPEDGGFLQTEVKFCR